MNINHDAIIKEVLEAKYKFDSKVAPIKKVVGLTKSDADMIILYVEEHKKNGSTLIGLMKPRSKVAEVLAKYGIVFENRISY